MASRLSRVLERVRPNGGRLTHNALDKGAHVSGKDRSLNGKARVKARKAKNKQLAKGDW